MQLRRKNHHLWGSRKVRCCLKTCFFVPRNNSSFFLFFWMLLDCLLFFFPFQFRIFFAKPLRLKEICCSDSSQCQHIDFHQLLAGRVLVASRGWVMRRHNSPGDSDAGSWGRLVLGAEDSWDGLLPLQCIHGFFAKLLDRQPSVDAALHARSGAEKIR